MGRSSLEKRRKNWLEKFSKIPEISTNDTYIRSKDKMLFTCNNDPTHPAWLAKPENILSGRGCPTCAGYGKKTPEAFVLEVAEKNPNIEVVGVYTTDREKIEFRCKIDNHIWEARPNHILRNRGCPVCGRLSSSKKQAMPKEDFLIKLAIKNPDVYLVDGYVSIMRKAEFACKKDSTHVNWRTRPNNILNHATGCPSCAVTGFKTNEPGYLYLSRILFQDTLYFKIGITNNEPSIRIKLAHKDFKQLAVRYFEIGQDAYDLEQEILNEMKSFRLKGEIRKQMKKHLKSGYTEILNKKPSNRLFNKGQEQPKFDL